MIVYLDSTFVIRRLLGVGKPAAFWGAWDKAYASTLMRTECFRAADALRLNGDLDDDGRSRLGAWIETVCDTVAQVPVTEAVMRRAGEAFPVAVNTLQAIHLATMLELQAAHGVKCDIASADESLVKAALSLGFAKAEESQASAKDEGEAEANGK